MKRIMLLFAIVACATYVLGQQPVAPAGSAPMATSVCAYTQTSGSGLTYFATCESVNGNVVQFTSPSGFEHIRYGSYTEGYGICDYYAGTKYYDYADAGASANWQAPITISISPLKIQRTTTDGVFTLTQTFTRVNPENILKIAMNLKNNYGSNSSGGRYVWFTRFVDIDANNGTSNNWMATRDAVIAWNDGWDGTNINQKYGLGLYTAPNSTAVSHFAGFSPFVGVQDPCTYPGKPTTVGSDDAGYAFHYFSLKPGASKTINVEYKRF